MKTHLLAVMVTMGALVSVSSLLQAAEIEGKVTMVNDRQISIRCSSELLPAVGDKLRVLVEIPGGIQASAATATVTAINGSDVVATIDNSTGAVLPGHLVLIESPAPTRSSGATAWGTPIDPDGDCTIREVDGKLQMKLSAKHHTFWYGGGGLFNAPRVLQEVEGDFTVQVKVTGNFDTGVKLPERFFNSAGLIILDTEAQYLRHERNLMNSPTYGDVSYATPLYDRGGQRIYPEKVIGPDFFSGKSSWLRVERAGDIVTTAVSDDGREWTTTGVLTTEFPERVKVGVLANNRPSEFSVEFEGLRITRGRPATKSMTAELPVKGWGTIIDPDADSYIVATPEMLRIVLASGGHDLWYGREDETKRYNAPRVLREVQGDFVARVKVTATWLGAPTESGSYTRAAGLLIYESDQHYLRHERNRFMSGEQPGVVWSWLPPLYDRSEQRISQWKSSRDDIFLGESTWLLMQRIGQTVHTWISHDGEDWKHTGTHETSFPDAVQVGLLAHGLSSEKYAITFEHFRLTEK